MKKNLFLFILMPCMWESFHDNDNTASAVWKSEYMITPNTVERTLVSGSTDVWLANQNKPATSEQNLFNSMGRVKLQKHVVDGHNRLYQDDFYKDGPNNIRVPNTNTIFEIPYEFELDENITIPAGSTLDFQGGSISASGNDANTITGNGTGIKAKSSERIFSDINIQGTWNVPDIYTEWMEMSHFTDSRESMASIMRLQDDDVYNNIYLPNEPLYFLPAESDTGFGKVFISLTSHTHLHIPNTINVIANSLPSYYVIYSSGKSDITIDGGGTLIGDCESHTYTEGSTHEQGHGIMLYKISNSTIKNITAKKFTGDGFYLGGNNNATITIKDILLYNLTSDSNRRQGLSVTASTDNLLIKNCKFINTGSINGTAPKSGIDIEPNTEFAVLKNILVEDCLFENNAGGDLKTHCNSIENLVAQNCTFINYTTDGGDILYGGYATEFRGYHKNTMINNCKIYGRINGHDGVVGDRSKVTFNNCEIKSIYTYDTDNQNNIADYVFNSCVISLKDEYTNHMNNKQTFICCRNNTTDYTFKNCYFSGNQNGLVTYKNANVCKTAAYNCVFDMPDATAPNFNELVGCRVVAKSGTINLVGSKGLLYDNNDFEIDNSSTSYVMRLSPKDSTITGKVFIRNCKFKYNTDTNGLTLHDAGYFSNIDLVIENIEATNILKFCNSIESLSNFNSVTVNQIQNRLQEQQQKEQLSVHSTFSAPLKIL